MIRSLSTFREALYTTAATLTSPLCTLATKTLEQLGASFLVHYAPKYAPPTLHELLDAWLQNPRVTGNKAEAVKRVIQAYRSHSGKLDLSHLSLTQLPPGLERLSLAALNVSGNRLTSLEGLEGCTNLQRLTATHNQLNSLAPLVRCTQLQWLMVQENYLTSLNGLEGCTNLQVLNVSATNTLLFSLKGIEDLPQLEWLITRPLFYPTRQEIVRLQASIRFARCDEDLDV